MEKIKWRNFEIEVWPGVYPPSDDSFLLAEWVEAKPGEKVLEMGCGCGLATLMAASQGAEVVAADINPRAVQNTIANCQRYGYKVKGIVSDLFRKVRGRFDRIYFNPPYLPHSADNDPLSICWDGGKDGIEVVGRFVEELRKHLRDEALVVMSSLADMKKFERKLNENELKWRIVDQRSFFYERIYLYRIWL